MGYSRTAGLLFVTGILCTASACKTRKMNGGSYEGSVKTSNYERNYAVILHHLADKLFEIGFGTQIFGT